MLKVPNLRQRVVHPLQGATDTSYYGRGLINDWANLTGTITVTVLCPFHRVMTNCGGSHERFSASELMSTSPNVAQFATVLADLASDLRRGACCLVVSDKGWTLPLYIGLKQRLQAANTRIGYLDGRVKDKDAAGAEGGVMLAAVAQLRWAVRTPEAENVVFALPHLDIMTAVEGGWTSISREVIPLLYENVNSVWLGFQDPSVTLPVLVEKVFTRRYIIEIPFRTLETATTVTAKELKEEPDTPAPADVALQPIHQAEDSAARSEPEPRRNSNTVNYSWEPGAGRSLRDGAPANPPIRLLLQPLRIEIRVRQVRR